MRNTRHAFDVDRDSLRYAMWRAGYHDARQLGQASLVSGVTIQRMLDGDCCGVLASTMCQLAVTLGCDVIDLMRENV